MQYEQKQIPFFPSGGRAFFSHLFESVRHGLPRTEESPSRKIFFETSLLISGVFFPLCASMQGQLAPRQKR